MNSNPPNVGFSPRIRSARRFPGRNPCTASNPWALRDRRSSRQVQDRFTDRIKGPPTDSERPQMLSMRGRPSAVFLNLGEAISGFEIFSGIDPPRHLNADGADKRRCQTVKTPIHLTTKTQRHRGGTTEEETANMSSHPWPRRQRSPKVGRAFGANRLPWLESQPPILWAKRWGQKYPATLQPEIFLTKHIFTTDFTDSIRIKPNRLERSKLPFGVGRIRVSPCHPWLKFRGLGSLSAAPRHRALVVNLRSLRCLLFKSSGSNLHR